MSMSERARSSTSPFWNVTAALLCATASVSRANASSSTRTDTTSFSAAAYGEIPADIVSAAQSYGALGINQRQLQGESIAFFEGCL